MKITCHACDAKYTIADEKVTGRTVKIKCKKCGATIVVNADGAAGAGPMSAPAPAYAEPQAQAHGPGDDDGLMATRVFGGDTSGGSVSTPDWTVSVSGDDERQMSQLQIAEEMQRGVITADTYVWRDGMSDWLPVSQVAELAALLTRAAPAAAPAYAPPAPRPVDDEPGMGLAGTMIMNEGAAPSPFAAPRPAAGGSPYAPPSAIAPAPAAALAPVTQPTAARRANRPSGAVDVFAAAAESREAGDRPRPPSPAARLGERNENSVLFSLSALTATENAASKKSSRDNDDAVIDMGFGRGGNGSRSAVDDLMNLGGGAIGGPMLAPPPLLAPVVEPPPAPMPVAAAMAPMSMAPGAMAGAMPGYGQQPPARSKTGLIIGIAAAVVVLGGVGAFFALSGGSTPTAEGSGSGSTTAAVTATTPTVSATAADTGSPAVTDTPAASGAPAASSAAVAVNDTGKPPTSGTGGGPTPTAKTSASATTSAAPTASAAPTPTPTASTAPAEPGGNRDFNKGAATTALASAASAAKGCKQPGGPTGSASVRVVFAPSGNVTSANVQGPPFAGTPVGGCIASAFRGAHVPAFDGSPVAVSKTVNIN